MGEGAPIEDKPSQADHHGDARELERSEGVTGLVSGQGHEERGAKPLSLSAYRGLNHLKGLVDHPRLLLRELLTLRVS